jgi:hypothetical protein
VKLEDLRKRINELIALADQVMGTKQSGEWESTVNSEKFHHLRSATLSFLKNTFGSDHPYYLEFDKKAVEPNPYDTEEGRGILLAVRQEIEGGWLFSVKGLISAEIFADFLDMAKYLLDEGYKDASAVMIGSVLEEHLRQLCVKNSISTETIKDGKPIAKKADLLNAELAKVPVYNKLDQKNVTAWLDLRNKAAHGNYSDYTREQVNLMYSAVSDFMSRNAI